MRLLIGMLLILGALPGSGQYVPLECDCQKAVTIKASSVRGFPVGPQGFGEVMEIKGSKNSPYYFEREINTAWFRLVVVTDGQLIFTIEPRDTLADYDFLLFEAKDENACDEIKRRKIKPVRSNISRNNFKEESMTGLAVNAKNNFQASGPGDSFSRSLPVKKDDELYLVINNVYGQKSGFQIRFDYYDSLEVSGFVRDDSTGQALGGVRLTWENLAGQVLSETMSNLADGSYRMQAPVLKRKKDLELEYILAASSEDDHFFKEEHVKVTTGKKLVSIDVVLPKLKKGKNMVLSNINFYGDEAVPLPSSESSFKRLYQLMKSNKSLSIQVEGHTNGCSHGIDFAQKLSEDRAMCLKKYLMDRGISGDRISTIGYNCTRMLFPQMRTDVERRMNRRVEIKVVGI